MWGTRAVSWHQCSGNPGHHDYCVCSGPPVLRSGRLGTLGHCYLMGFHGCLRFRSALSSTFLCKGMRGIGGGLSKAIPPVMGEHRCEVEFFDEILYVSPVWRFDKAGLTKGPRQTGATNSAESDDWNIDQVLHPALMEGTITSICPSYAWRCSFSALAPVHIFRFFRLFFYAVQLSEQLEGVEAKHYISETLLWTTLVKSSFLPIYWDYRVTTNIIILPHYRAWTSNLCWQLELLAL